MFAKRHCVLLFTLFVAISLSSCVVQRHPRAQPTTVAVVQPAPGIGKKVKVLPRGASVIRFGGKRYHYLNGVYFKPTAAGYVDVSGPVGHRVSILPKGYRVVKVRGTKYFSANGTYYVYRPKTRNYEIVSKPR